MDHQVELGFYIFILAGFLGFHVISRVPPLLHTPLMSATNALSGISLVGSLVVCGEMHNWVCTLFGFVAVACSSTNVVGGFLITDRMLRMFKTERDRQQAWWQRLAMPAGWTVLAIFLVLLWFIVVKGHVSADVVLKYLYLASGVLFILGLKGLSSPRYARHGMFLAEIGMIAAVVG